MRTRLLIASAIVLLAAGCSTYSMTSSSALGVPGLTDSDIGQVITTANQGEIDQANAALAKASSADVRAFAQMMVNDHTAALNATNTLLTDRNITPSTTNSLASQLQSGSSQTIAALDTYSGTSFDRQYIDAQVNLHQWLLSTLDNSLIPSTHDRRFRDLLQNQRSTVAMHLDRARQLQGTLGR
jgi:putative membrane protein